MEYLLRTMFSDVPRRRTDTSPRGSSAGGGSVSSTPRAGQDGGADPAETELVVKCVPEKRALHVEVVLKRLRVPAEEIAAAINMLNAESLKVSGGSDEIIGLARADCYAGSGWVPHSRHMRQSANMPPQRWRMCPLAVTLDANCLLHEVLLVCCHCTAV